MSIIYRYSSNRKMELIILITLVGYTGFVGSNICENMHIDKKYNSKNVIEAYGTNPDLLIYAGVRAEKFLANQDEKLDFEVVKEAFNNIKKINPKKLVLISTIDVYKNPNIVNEAVLRAISNYFNTNEITILNGDYKEVLKDLEKEAFVYLDPPYMPI